MFLKIFSSQPPPDEQPTATSVLPRFFQIVPELAENLRRFSSTNWSKWKMQQCTYISKFKVVTCKIQLKIRHCCKSHKGNVYSSFAPFSPTMKYTQRCFLAPMWPNCITILWHGSSAKAWKCEIRLAVSGSISCRVRNVDPAYERGRRQESHGQKTGFQKQNPRLFCYMFIP